MPARQLLNPPFLLLSRHTLLDRLGPPQPDSHFHARPEPVEDRHQAIDGEAAEIRIADTREVGCRDPGAPMSRAHAQAFPIERLDDFGSEDCLELLGIRVLVPEVAENTPAPAHHFRLFAFYRNISFSLILLCCRI